jgi:hypothetical protein
MAGKKITCIILTAAFLLAGCNSKTDISISSTESTSGSTTATTTAASSESTETTTVPAATTTTEAEQKKFEFNPHLMTPTLLPDIPQDYWDSFHNLCDALREGKNTFECSSKEAYEWATDPVTLTELFPAACNKVKNESDDGSKPFENGVGRIYYTIPIEEYLERQSAFEKYITETINKYVEYDDTDFEKCLKLYDYMERNFSYETFPGGGDGANYYTIMNHTGVCNELASVYSYYLLQVGVEAFHVGCFDELDHAWTYMVIDGKGYYSDPTWSLISEGEDLPLYYFIMNADRRVESGCPVDDLTLPLLPKYWLSRSKSTFSADDDSLLFPSGSFMQSIDEEKKVIRYQDIDKIDHEFGYANY